ncbi:MAG: hypothetical protein VB104_12400 [Candidatus Limiplasma sp.]|nr:hypothetical protein [Candidatus Limiplasma sp.]
MHPQSYQEYGSAERSDAIRWDALESNRLFIVSKGSAMSLANKFIHHRSRIIFAVGEAFDHSLAKSVAPDEWAHSRACAWGVRFRYRSKRIPPPELPASCEGLRLPQGLHAGYGIMVAERQMGKPRACGIPFALLFALQRSHDQSLGLGKPLPAWAGVDIIPDGI